VAAIALALGSSLVWGCADFFGGVLSRRLALAGVTIVSQAAGFVALFVWLAGDGFRLGGRVFALGLLAGVGGGIGLACFYRALAVGTMSVVSPVAACGALVPFALALASGERPSGLVVGGAVAALAGAVLASAEEFRADEPARRLVAAATAAGDRDGKVGAGFARPDRSQGALLAVAAAAALGLFVYFIGLAGKHGDTLSALVGARVGSLTLLVAAALASRSALRLTRRDVPAVAVLGLLDTTANGLFVLASARGYLSIVSVLGSLYPVVTVLAAHVLLGERVSRAQRLGVALALGGVAVVASG
jgi:drug/metabolite transporter (DMT)-like permease